MIKQLLDATLGDIKFIQSHQESPTILPNLVEVEIKRFLNIQQYHVTTQLKDLLTLQVKTFPDKGPSCQYSNLGLVDMEI